MLSSLLSNLSSGGGKEGSSSLDQETTSTNTNDGDHNRQEGKQVAVEPEEEEEKKKGKEIITKEDTTMTAIMTTPQKSKSNDKNAGSASTSYPCTPPQTLPSENQSYHKPTTWKEAQDDYCRKHGVLKVSLQQLIEEYDESSSLSSLSENQEVTWELPSSSSEVVITNEDFLKYHNSSSSSSVPQQPSTATSSSITSTPRKVFGMAKSIATSATALIFSPLIQGGKTDEYDDYIDETSRWTQENDDAYSYYNDATSTTHGDNQTSTTAADSNDTTLLYSQPWIHPKLTHACLLALQQNIQNLSSSNSSTTTTTTTTPPHQILFESDWPKYCRDVINENQNMMTTTMTSRGAAGFATTITTSTTEWLLELLIETKYAKRIKNTNDDKSLSSPSYGSHHHHQTKIVLASNVHDIDMSIPSTIFDLQYTQKQLTNQIEKDTLEIDKCREMAKSYKIKGHKKLAIAQLRKHKMLSQRLDMTGDALLNLEKVQSAIEQSQSNTSYLNLLQQSNSILKDVNKNNQELLDSGVVEDLEDTYQDLLESDAAVSSSLLGANGFDIQIDEDELLKELEGLSLMDAKEKVTVTTTTAIKATTKSTTSTAAGVASKTSTTTTQNENVASNNDNDDRRHACMESAS